MFINSEHPRIGGNIIISLLCVACIAASHTDHGLIYERPVPIVRIPVECMQIMQAKFN